MRSNLLKTSMSSSILKKLKWLVMIMAMSVVARTNAQIPAEGFREDFSNPEKINPRLSIDKKWKIAGGMLTSSAGNEMPQISIKNLNLENVSVSFTVKVVRGSGDNTHFGVCFDLDEDRMVQAYSFLNRFNLLETEKGQSPSAPTVQHITVSDYSKEIAVGENSAFVCFRVEMLKGKGEVFRDGKYMGRFETKTGNISRIRLYTWGGDISIKDIEIKKLALAEKVELKKSTDARPIFYATFDSDASAQDLQFGKSIKPLVMQNVEFVPGISGKGIHITTTPHSSLKYNASGLFATESGTLMFWYKPDWDGLSSHHGNQIFVVGVDKNKSPLLKVFMDHFLQVKMKENANVDIGMWRYCHRYIFANEWIHVALVWNANGWNKLFLNGVKYQHGAFPGPIFPKKGIPALHGIETLLIGENTEHTPGQNNADGVLDELKIYNLALPDQEIVTEYQKYYPVSISLDQRFIPSKTKQTVALWVEPLAVIGVNPANNPGSGNMDIALTNIDGKEEVFKTRKTIQYNASQKVLLNVGPLVAGTYYLTCVLNGESPRLSRIFRVMVYDPPKEQQRGGDLALAPGAPVVEIDLTTLKSDEIYRNVETQLVGDEGLRYREAGKNKGDRFAAKVRFPEDLVRAHKPVLLSIRWPDDRPRSAGFYMYVKTRSQTHRDRLEGGIQSGEEFPPLTGKMQTTSYIFYPGVTEYLFEARTMTQGMPAAVASISFRAIEERFPRLNIKCPKGVNPRRLGHMDEDQTFELYLNEDDLTESHSLLKPVILFNRVCEYFAYTGQSVIAYPLLRYFYVYYDLPGQADSGNVRQLGWVALFLDLLQDYGMKMIGTVNLSSMPEFWLPQDELERLKAEGCMLRDKDGKWNSGGTVSVVTSPVHPAVRKAFLKHIEEVLKRFGSHPAFGGLDLWVTPAWTYGSLDQGYDDFAVELFCAETGVSLPSNQGPDRFKQRYELLTGKHRNAWLKWRSGKTMEMLHAVRGLIDKCNPGLTLYVNGQTLNPVDFQNVENPDRLDFSDYAYEANGLNFKEIKSMSSTVLVPNRNCTRYRWLQHWSDTPSIMEELTYDRAKYVPFLHNGSTSIWTLNTYFETWNDSLLPAEFASYFQSADVKPQGRHFLKEYAFDVAAMDADMILVGGQPLGTLGREAEIREFAQAFCALPAQPFKVVDRLRDPVTVRYLTTPSGTYVYFVNLLWSDVTVTTVNAGKGPITDLSTGKKLESAGNTLTVQLKPYELRSFLDRGNTIQMHLADSRVDIPAEVGNWYNDNLKVFTSAEKVIRMSGSWTKIFEDKLNRVKQALKNKQYLEAHRLLYAKELSETRKRLGSGDPSVFIKQAEMIKQGYYGVKCGSSEFYKAPDGRLFFPDKPYSEGSYGYIGSCQKIIRNIDNLHTAIPKLFSSEAYDLEGYRFTLPNGKYTVKLYMKIGYEPSANPGIYVVDIDIAGKNAAKDLDLFVESGKDFHNVLIKEFKDAQVSRGVLDINWSTQDGKDPTTKLCNAIEIIPQH